MKTTQNTNISKAIGCNKSPAIYTGGKNPRRLIAAFIAAVLLFAVFTGCKHDSDPPLKKPTKTTVTANITVPKIDTVTNPMQFGPVSAYTGYNDHFSASDITYTLVLSQGGTAKVTVDSTSATSISAAGQTNGVYTLTQTFLYKGSPISGGSRSVAMQITSNAFSIGVGMMVSEGDIDPANLKPLTLNLSKKL